MFLRIREYASASESGREIALRSTSSSHGRRCERLWRIDAERRERKVRNAGGVDTVCWDWEPPPEWSEIGNVGGLAIIRMRVGKIGNGEGAWRKRWFDLSLKQPSVYMLTSWSDVNTLTKVRANLQRSISTVHLEYSKHTFIDKKSEALRPI